MCEINFSKFKQVRDYERTTSFLGQEEQNLCMISCSYLEINDVMFAEYLKTRTFCFRALNLEVQDIVTGYRRYPVLSCDEPDPYIAPTINKLLIDINPYHDLNTRVPNLTIKEAKLIISEPKKHELHLLSPRSLKEFKRLFKINSDDSVADPDEYPNYLGPSV